MEGPYGGVLKGKDRCRGVKLERGDCPFARWPGSAYCYYHDKLFTGLTEPSAPVYPVWPLPKNGYVILEDPVLEEVA